MINHWLDSIYARSFMRRRWFYLHYLFSMNRYITKSFKKRWERLVLAIWLVISDYTSQQGFNNINKISILCFSVNFVFHIWYSKNHNTLFCVFFCEVVWPRRVNSRSECCIFFNFLTDRVAWVYVDSCH